MAIRVDYEFFRPPAHEKSFYLSDARKMLAGIDNRASYWTLRDCAHYGRCNSRQEIVRLRVCMLPSGLGTTVEEFQRFREQLNPVEPE